MSVALGVTERYGKFTRSRRSERISPDTFKAIRPAKGWTKKALERAARKIEFVQGWEIEQSGRYFVDEAGNVLEKSEQRKSDLKLSQKARDIEAHTGAESVERVAKREILPILENAESWEELHKNLSERRAQLKRRGKGAVLHFYGSTLKLSTLSRKCSFTAMERRLGNYIPDILQSKDGLGDPIVEVSKVSSVVSSEIKNSWDDYQAEKEKYYEVKKSAIENLRTQQKEEYKTLQEEQKLRWRKVNRDKWQDKGRDLPQVRKLLSFYNKAEQLNLRDEHRAEMLELKSHFLQKFPSFKKWLLEQEREEDYKKYRFPGAFILSPEQSGIFSVETPKGIDLRDYLPHRGSGDKCSLLSRWKINGGFFGYGKKNSLEQKNSVGRIRFSGIATCQREVGSNENHRKR